MHPTLSRLGATPRAVALASLTLALAATMAGAQADTRWEKQLAAGSRVRIHNLSGNVTITPSTSGKVEIVGHRTRDGDVPAKLVVKETSDGVIACVLWSDVDGQCDEDGYSIHGDRDDDGWGRHSRRGEMDLEVHVPATMRVSGGSVSGDVTVRGAQGDVRASSVSGNVRVESARASSLRVSSVSGNVDAQIDAFTGTGEISARSVSGDVTLQLPKALDADVSIGTVSGRIDSEYEMTLNGRMNRRRIEARIGKGGRDLSISTVSGDVRLRAAK